MVLEKLGDGWWSGEIHGRSGIFPTSYVQELHWLLPLLSFCSLLRLSRQSCPVLFRDCEQLLSHALTWLRRVSDWEKYLYHFKMLDSHSKLWVKHCLLACVCVCFFFSCLSNICDYLCPKKWICVGNDSLLYSGIFFTKERTACFWRISVKSLDLIWHHCV